MVWGLNTLFVRYGCGTVKSMRIRIRDPVLIPYSSGMGVGRHYGEQALQELGLNTLFVRYGCGTAAGTKPARTGSLNTLFVRYGCGTYLMNKVLPAHCLNTLFVRYGCGTLGGLDAVATPAS